MYTLKQIPEDFIVTELSDYETDDSGSYAYFVLKKRNCNTLHAIKILCETLKVNQKDVGFAGNKDKNAVTHQIISIKNGKKEHESISLKDISLEYVGNGTESIFLGKLKGNSFEITIRNLTDAEVETVKKGKATIPNLFGPQRFSKLNDSIGKAIVAGNFKEAVELVLETNSDYENDIRNHLQQNNNDYVGALKTIPFKLLQLYVHAFQSRIFNTTMEKIAEKRIDVSEVPLVGFGTVFSDDKVKEIVSGLLKEEGVSLRDFIIRAIPDLSQEGDIRKAFLAIDDFAIVSDDADELNDGKKKVTVSFSLPKGAYATVVIDQLMH